MDWPLDIVLGDTRDYLKENLVAKEILFNLEALDSRVDLFAC